ncbi:DNA polymerase I [Buchnera aphidicola str. Ak (Acyrthosiphon kondoi)]|uniref:DNA polymerase I n=1 Tax=Buchnera aphidicola str. Ak (Acyrthosiphon kondoi) TaxID=1005090 RepID=G2LND1_9GAMM|nr:5'-3' exonuclease [Buchnera aphidicola]AEO08769.1 DNA polymerase I [Buchnera aphidicola str. Ak (Acyrthosiphon kondoi)]
MNQIKKNPVIIIDGSLYLYSSYYGFRDFNKASGEPFGAIYGILKMIDNILKKYEKSKKIIIVFDSPQKTFRTKLFKEYKKNRSPMPNSLSIQIPPLFEILKKIGIKILTMPGIEADDIIGSLSYKLEKKGEKILIISHDKDMLQLVSPNINIFNKKDNRIITPEVIKERYGIKPKEFIDFLALIGDVSDNIPGVPKIGIKTALSLLHKFSNIKNIYNNIENIKLLPFRNAKNIAIQLKDNKKQAFLSYELAAIKLNIPININSKEIILKKYSSQNTFQILKSYIFKIK